MSAGNLTNGTLSLNTLYVDGVSITGAAGAGVNSLEGLTGELVIADDGQGSMAVGTSGNNITIDTTMYNVSGVAPMVAGSNGIDITVVGASISSIILVSIHTLDQITSTHILSAAPSANKIEVVLSANASVATTGSVQWTVLQF